MTPFLKQIAEIYYKEQGSNISDTCFVFPSRRAGKFFIEHLKNISKENILAPECLTISEFFDTLSPGFEKEEKIGLLFHLYDSYKKVTGYEESFNEFIGLGEIILKDFNDIDNYLVDAKYMFLNIEELERYSLGTSLTEEQKQCLATFLKLCTDNPSKYKEKTYSLWCKMLEIYNHFREKLFSEGIGYEGMIHRNVVENEIPNHLLPQKVVFVGFNALDGATKVLFDILKDKNIADFYWDYDFKYADISKDTENKAHYFTEFNTKKYKSQYKLEKENYPETTIHAIACNSNIGQTKYVSTLLNEELKNDNGIKSALVLANETLLVPMLYALPVNNSEEQSEDEEEIKSSNPKVNITMGYPIKSSNTYNFIDLFLFLHRNYSKDKGYRTDDVRAILSHPNIVDLCKGDIEKIDIKIYHNLYIKPEILPSENELLEKIFTPCDSNNILTELLNIVKLLKANVDEIEQECILQASMAINRVQSLLERYSNVINIDSIAIYRIMMSILKTVNLSFIGEPLSGLQMMGMLETRCLDFDNIIITSFNEGVFPKSDIGSSLIPYSVRKPYGLPTTEHQDAIFAYNFYRLIKRASNVWLIYDTRNDSEGSSGEISRFVKQLEYLYNVDVHNISVSNTTKVSENKEIIIKKSKEDIDKIEYFLEKKGLSPTVLNTYICCPLHFYYEKIKGVYEKTEPSAIINSAQFGTIFHSIMENLYIPFKGKVVNKSDLRAISDDQIKELAQKVFTAVVYDLDDLSEENNYNFTITGENLIIYEIIVKLVKNTLLCDIERTPFTHYEDEITIDKIYTTAKGNKVKIKGTIDRIDIKEDKVYLIDYKTTSLKNDLNATKVYEIETLENFFDNDANYLANSKKYVKEILQMCFYNLLYAEKAGGKKIETYLYLAKKSFDIDNFLENTRVDLPENWEFKFREHLDKVIDDLLDIEKPIIQSKEPKNLNCKYCPFIPICGKIVKDYH